MVPVTGDVQRSAWNAGVLPPVEEVRKGLWSIPVPIPQGVLRYVLVYALELVHGLALVDAGWDTPESWSALNEGLLVAGGSINDVRAVVVSHIHRDHSGQAGRIRELTGAWIGLHPADAALPRSRFASSAQFAASVCALLEIAGVLHGAYPEVNTPPKQVGSFDRLSPPDRLIEDGDDLGQQGWDLRAIWSPGHAPGHLCLFSESRRILFTGDHVLPRISPNISIHSTQNPNPLADYLDSLEKVKDINCDEVLPGHEWRFSSLRDRTTGLRQHHRFGLDEILWTLDGASELTCWEIATRLTWSRELDTSSPFVQRTASGETLAHLALLEHEGTVVRDPGTPARFRLAAPLKH